MIQIVAQKELNYLVDRNNVLVRLKRIFSNEMICILLAIARALIRNPKILLLDEGKKHEDVNVV